MAPWTMRRLPIALASLSALAVIASLVTAPAAQAAPAPLSPSVNLKGTTIDRTLFGMHVFNLQDGVFPTVPIGSIRLWDNQTTWSSIETSQNVFDWTKLDSAVNTARGNGVSDILMVLAGTPSWGTDDPTSGGAAGVLQGAAGMPKDLADWDDWVRQVATRYKGKITAYQPWNEANLVTFSTGTPQEMAQLTKRAYDIIKSIDPSATVVAPEHGYAARRPLQAVLPRLPSRAQGAGLAGRRVGRPHLPRLPRDAGGPRRAGPDVPVGPRRRGRTGPADLGHREQLRPGRTRGREPRPGHRRPAGRGLDRPHLPRCAPPRHQPGVLVRLGTGERSRRHPDEHRATRCDGLPHAAGLDRRGHVQRVLAGRAAATSPVASPRTARSSGSCTRRSAAPPSRRRASARSARSTGRASRSPRRRSGRSARSSCASSPPLSLSA